MFFSLVGSSRDWRGPLVFGALAAADVDDEAPAPAPAATGGVEDPVVEPEANGLMVSANAIKS